MHPIHDGPTLGEILKDALDQRNTPAGLGQRYNALPAHVKRLVDEVISRGCGGVAVVFVQDQFGLAGSDARKLVRARQAFLANNAYGFTS